MRIVRDDMDEFEEYAIETYDDATVSFFFVNVSYYKNGIIRCRLCYN